MEQQLQLEEAEKIFYDKDFTSLKEKLQNLHLNDAFVEIMRDKAKEIEKHINTLVCLNKIIKGDFVIDKKTSMTALSNRQWSLYRHQRKNQW